MSPQSRNRSLDRRTIMLALFYLAATAALVGAIGAATTSVSAIHDRLAVDADPYWNDRLLASLLLGSVGLFFVAITGLLGAILATSRNTARALAGWLVVALTIAPHAASVINLLILTPEDWAHTIPHLLAIVLATAGLVIGWATMRRSTIVGS